MQSFPQPREPLVEELSPAPSPESVFAALAGLPHAVFFDSAMRHAEFGRYSYVAAEPYDWLTVDADASPALPRLARRLAEQRGVRVEGLPPWQGGAAGLLGYEIGRSLEQLPRPKWDEFQMPALAVGLYDTVVAFDHVEDRAWIVAHDRHAGDRANKRDPSERVARFRGLLESEPATKATPVAVRARLEPSAMAPSFEVNGVLSDFSRERYLVAVRRAIDHLRAGDAYQINLSQRLLLPDPGDPVSLYRRLRAANAAPFAGYLDGRDWQVLSTSPERFLRVERDRVETRPIKGTRPRGRSTAEDDRLGRQLTESEKDRAENVMIVDLLRNDLSRVCRDDSVEAPVLFGLEKYAHVQHLVSVVHGKLKADRGVCDLLAATAPGGSITGAPKVRAQQLIAELEPTARGAYCGNLFWIGFVGADGRQAMDSSVLIRTLTRAKGWIQAPVGGGVVVGSDPEQEYEETWHKAVGLVEAVAR